MKKEIERIIEDIEEVKYHYWQLRDDNEDNEELYNKYDALVEFFVDIETDLLDILYEYKKVI